MSIDRVISGAQVWHEGSLRDVDILIDEGRIVGLMGDHAAAGVSAGEVVDGAGLWALPGGVDVHVHTREPGYTHKEDITTCTQAAAAGGYTTIFGMPNLDPPTMTTENLDDVLAMYAAKSLVDYNHNPAAKLPDELAAMAERGIAAYKIFMVVDTGRSYPHPAAIGVHDHGDLYVAMKTVAETGLRLMIHPHDQSIMDVVEQGYWERGDRSPRAYSETLAADDGIIWDTATALILRMAEATGCKLHILHTQTIRQIEMIQEARSRGVDVSCETNHWTLFLGTREDIDEQGSYALSYWVPPHHQAEVWEAIADGRIDMLASDHAPHTREEKEVGWTDAWAAHTGTPGIQHQMPLMLNALAGGRLSLGRLVDAVSTKPATHFGLDNKGRIAVGADADVVLVDPNKTWTIRNEDVLSKIGWTNYDGRSVTGSVERTMVRGTDVWAEGGRVVGQPGYGRQAKRS